MFSLYPSTQTPKVRYNWNYSGMVYKLLKGQGANCRHKRHTFSSKNSKHSHYFLSSAKIWFKNKRDAKVRDIILRKDATAADQSDKYVRVIKEHEGTDSWVRSADVEYKVPGKSKFRSSTRPFTSLCLWSLKRNRQWKMSGTQRMRRGVTQGARRLMAKSEVRLPIKHHQGAHHSF